ncbi:MAG: cupin domain-containing protein [Devosia sp.]
MTSRVAVVSFPDSPQLGRAPHGSPILVHATSAQTGGAIGMWETFVPPGKGPEPHTHTRETEVFRVIAGTFRFHCGTETIEAPTGTVVTLPPNVPHSWVNIGDTMGQVMGIASPGGCEELFLAIARLDNPTPRDIAMIERSLGIANEETRKLD